MPETSFPVEVIEGVPVVTAPEEIDITNADGLQAALLEAVLLERRPSAKRPSAKRQSLAGPWSWSTCPGPGSVIPPG